MTAAIIQRYYLNIGASFRKSDAWREAFLDDSDHSKIVRSGRFGIGALAAYLIGSEIKLTTRHHSVAQDRALTFRAEIDTESIEIQQCVAHVGTTIRITISEMARRPLKEFAESFSKKERQWWEALKTAKSQIYRLEAPSLRVSLTQADGSSEHHNPRDPQPSEIDSFKAPWRTTNTKDFPRVHWSRERNDAALTCNGLVLSGDGIYAGVSAPGRRRHSLGSLFDIPTLAIFDPDGRLPINLSRSGLVEFPTDLADALIRSRTNDLLCRALIKFPDVLTTKGDIPQWPTTFYPQMRAWVITKEGFCPFLSPFLTGLNPTEIWFVPARQDLISKLIVSKDFGDRSMIIPYEPATSHDAVIRFLRMLMQRDSDFRGVALGVHPVLGSLKVAALSFLAAADQIASIVRSKSVPRYIKQWLEGAGNSDGIISSASFGNRTLRHLVELSHDGYLSGIFRWQITGDVEEYIEDSDRYRDDEKIVQEWRRTIPALIIPHSTDARRDVIDRAKKSLPEYLKLQEAFESETPA